jgi:sugar/nucleoside kinase (ribokinase family)
LARFSPTSGALFTKTNKILPKQLIFLSLSVRNTGMSKESTKTTPIFVEGLINIESSLKISGFPLEYYPIDYPFFGIQTNVSGNGINIAKALKTLGSQVRPCGLIAQDQAGRMILQDLEAQGLVTDFILPRLQATPETIVLYDTKGRRQIHNDLKDIQDALYPEELVTKALGEADLAILGNMNFARPFLKAAKALGKTIATDVHVLADIHDPYNEDFLAAADILFLSHDNISGDLKDFIRRLTDTYPLQTLVMGLGAEGALLYQRDHDSIQAFPAIYTRKVENTVGAGDALFSAFCHFTNQGQSPEAALSKAMVFASYKVGESGAARGFLREAELLEWAKQRV